MLSNPLTEAPFPQPGAPADPGRIDVHDLIRSGAGTGPALGTNQVKNRPNEIHAMLCEKYASDVAAGQFDLGVLDDAKRRRRIRNYWLAVIAIDVPLGALAIWVGPNDAIPFVLAIAAVAMLTSILTWQTFFLRTHY